MLQIKEPKNSFKMTQACCVSSLFFLTYRKRIFLIESCQRTKYFPIFVWSCHYGGGRGETIVLKELFSKRLGNQKSFICHENKNIQVYKNSNQSITVKEWQTPSMYLLLFKGNSQTSIVYQFDKFIFVHYKSIYFTGTCFFTWICRYRMQ